MSEVTRPPAPSSGSAKLRIAKNTSWNYIRTGSTILLRILLLPIMLNKLGAATYGVYVLVGSITESSSLLQSSFGLSITKYVAEYSSSDQRDRMNRLVNTAMVVFVVSGAVLLLTYLVFALLLLNRVFNIPDDLDRTAVTYALTMLVYFAADYMQKPFYRLIEGVQRYDVLAKLDVTREALRFVLIAVVLYSGRGLIGVGVVNVALASIALTIHIVAAGRLLPQFRFNLRDWDRSEFGRVFGFSWKMTVAKLNGFLGDKINPWLVGAFIGTGQVALYSIADRIHSLARTPALVMGSALVPVASSLDAKGEQDRIAGLYIRGAKYTVAISLPFVLAGIIEAEWIVRYWLGPDFTESVRLIQLYLSYLIVYVMIMSGGEILVGAGRLNLILKPMYFATTINLIISVWLVRTIGTAGVIVGSVVGNLIIWVISLFIAFNKIGVPPGRFFREVVLRVYLVAGLVYAGLWWLTTVAPPSNIIWVVAYGALAAGVFGVLLVTISLLPSERDELRSLWGLVRARLGR